MLIWRIKFGSSSHIVVGFHAAEAKLLMTEANAIGIRYFI